MTQLLTKHQEQKEAFLKVGNGVYSAKNLFIQDKI